jgi:ribonucleotide reductase beta subunit family protein with ferritin-like domain
MLEQYDKLPRILTPKDTYTIDYEQAIEYATTQTSIFWLPDEVEVSKDLHDLKTNFTEAEYHGVVSTTKLFTLYELVVGEDYWSGKISKTFRRPDIQRMANCFSFFELNVHAVFYNKLNEVLGLNTDEFYSSYVDDPVLKDRMKWIGRAIDKPSDTIYDVLRSLATFSMIEGAVLYSNFAFFKHFGSNGKNKLVNLQSGINFSINDENIHSEAGAWLYQTVKKESLEMGLIGQEDINKLEKKLIETGGLIVEHESRIIDMIFEHGKIKGITDVQMKHFIEHRVDLCLEFLSIRPIFKPKYNVIKGWFYDNINAPRIHDFFNSLGNSYNRNWNPKKFIWTPQEDTK